jgi:hypothetical protein
MCVCVGGGGGGGWVVRFSIFTPETVCKPKFSCLRFRQGQSRTTVTAVIFVVGCWCVCIPLAFISTECTQLKLFGLWISLLCGYCVATILALWIVWRSDWPKLAEDAVQRQKEEAKESHGDVSASIENMQDAFTVPLLIAGDAA